MIAPHHDPTQPPGLRLAVDALVATLVATLALAACDTGDGKTLTPPAVAFTTTVAPPPTLLSVPLGTNELITVPSETIASLPQPFTVFAPWQDGAALDPRYTCDGEEIAPAVSWASPPQNTSELAIALVDESTLDSDGPLVHWVLVGVDPNELSVREDVVPPGAVQGLNSFGSIGYSGPCPPAGDEPHVYRLTVYALNQQSELADGTSANELLDFIEDVALGATSVTGTARR
jgi:Raf kinase inhibitor-like YbhB/YbcL family protein